jgi:Zn-dependent protease
VEVHPGHFLLAALLGYRSQDWRDTRTAALYLILWMAIVFFSVLLHEMGHAVTSLVFGYRPVVQLVWTGGLTHPNAGGPIPWHRDILLTLAGPLAGLVLGGVCLLVSLTLHPPPGYLRYALGNLTYVNIFWSLLNLAPVIPMDGGKIASVLLIRVFGRRGFLFAQILSLLVCAVGIAWLAATTQQPYLLIFLVMFGLRAFGGVTAYLRGEIPDPNSAAMLPFTNAQALYSEGKLPEAKQLAELSLQSATSEPKLRSRLHHLLGWIAVKEGNGRAALDHFSQIERETVEPHALAAAFSLVGDDARALSFWELAYAQHPDPTVLHEWAGALIRNNRVDDARKLPGVDMPGAYTCAERVFFIRGEFAAAAKVGLAALEEHPSADTAYDVACAMARAGDREGALRLLDRATELGFRKRNVAASDPDLASLHAEPRFQAWLARRDNSAAR